MRFLVSNSLILVLCEVVSVSTNNLTASAYYSSNFGIGARFGYLEGVHNSFVKLAQTVD